MAFMLTTYTGSQLKTHVSLLPRDLILKLLTCWAVKQNK